MKYDMPYMDILVKGIRVLRNYMYKGLMHTSGQHLGTVNKCFPCIYLVGEVAIIEM